MTAGHDPDAVIAWRIARARRGTWATARQLRDMGIPMSVALAVLGIRPFDGIPDGIPPINRPKTRATPTFAPSLRDANLAAQHRVESHAKPL